MTTENSVETVSDPMFDYIEYIVKRRLTALELYQEASIYLFLTFLYRKTKISD